MKRRTLVLLLVSFGLASGLHAQSAEDLARNALQERANRILEITSKSTSDHTNEFNTKISETNTVRPLEPQNLDSVTIGLNVSRTLQFLQYLKEYLTFDHDVLRSLNDSIFAIKQDLPPGVDENALNVYEESLKINFDAFDKYIGALSKVYSQVLDVLTFLQHTSHTMVNKQLQFNSSEDLAQYKKRMAAIDLSTKELSKASEESKKATEIANKKLAASRGDNSGGKDGGAKKPATKKSTAK